MHAASVAIEKVFTGVQMVSKNQVEMSYLQDQEKVFDARRAHTQKERK